VNGNPGPTVSLEGEKGAGTFPPGKGKKGKVLFVDGRQEGEQEARLHHHLEKLSLSTKSRALAAFSMKQGGGKVLGRPSTNRRI